VLLFGLLISTPYPHHTQAAARRRITIALIANALAAEVGNPSLDTKPIAQGDGHRRSSPRLRPSERGAADERFRLWLARGFAIALATTRARAVPKAVAAAALRFARPDGTIGTFEING
jgi:hypothetical protein